MSNGKSNIFVKIMAGILAGLMVSSMCFTVIAFFVQAK